jgi:hypothetical protein
MPGSTPSFEVPTGAISPLRSRPRPGSPTSTPFKQDIYLFMTSLTIKLSLFLLVLLSVLASSIFTYWFLYFRLVPSRSFAYPAHLGPDGCMSIYFGPVQWTKFSNVPISSPNGNMPNLEDAIYDITLSLSLPESYEQQTFVTSEIFRADNSMRAHSVRSFVPYEHSTVAEVLWTLAYAWPEFLGIYKRTKQVHAVLFEQYPEVAEIAKVNACFEPRNVPVHEGEINLTLRNVRWSLKFLLAQYPFVMFALFVAVVMSVFGAVGLVAMVKSDKKEQ